ncbi:hypothetical protein [Anaerotignum sp.]|nr:hypothetical protein [Anaerotignum sp.]MBQ7758556.1 hypothetical protein [Anaerotignum sp.]
MQKDVFKGLFSPENKKMRSNVFLALMAGILLLAAGKSFSSFGGDAPEVSSQEERTETAIGNDGETEKRMAEILSKIEGAGQVDVMLTYRRTEEKTVARDEVREESYTEDGGKTSESLRVENTAILTEDKSGNTSPLILSETSPEVEGVVIVAEGGGDATVCAALNQAAQALLDVPAHKIAVLKMK